MDVGGNQAPARNRKATDDLQATESGLDRAGGITPGGGRLPRRAAVEEPDNPNDLVNSINEFRRNFR